METTPRELELVVSTCTDPQRSTVVLETSTATCFGYTTVVPGKPARLSKEACLYASTDWLSSYVSQRVATGQFLARASDVVIKGEVIKALLTTQST